MGGFTWHDESHKPVGQGLLGAGEDRMEQSYSWENWALDKVIIVNIECDDDHIYEYMNW